MTTVPPLFDAIKTILDHSCDSPINKVLRSRYPFNVGVLIFLLSTLSVGCGHSESPLKVEQGILVTNSTIVTVNNHGDLTIKKGDILIDGPTIVAIRDSIPAIEGPFQTIDGSGKNVIPGLIDSHVHLNNMSGIPWNKKKIKPEMVREYFDRLPKNYLYHGYTSLIDVDNHAPKMIEDLRAGSPAPDIHTCGKRLQIMDDFEMVLSETPMEERYGSTFLYDRYNPDITYPDSIDLNRHTPEYLIDGLSRENNICIKTLYEDASSGLPQNWELPSGGIIEDVVAASHAKGMPVLMHAPSYGGQKFALEHKIDIIAHAMWNWTDDPDSYLDIALPKSHKAVLMTIANRKIGYQPTLRTLMGEKDILQQKFHRHPGLKKLYSDKFLAYIEHEEAPEAKARILARSKFLKRNNPDFYWPIRNKFGNDEAMFHKLFESYQDRMVTVVRTLSDYNALFLFGTDTGAMNMYTQPPGLNGYLEMEHWVNAGLTLEQVFRAATHHNAMAFGLLDAIGTVEEGKRANLLILEGNPLEDITAYDQIDQIILKGKPMNRTDLKVHSTL